MTVSNPTYDLVLLLDPDAEEPTRARIIADARAAIEADGEALRHDAWGNRALSYPIQRRTSAEYHLLQFKAGSPELLSHLNRSLRITDGILRFRIIKLKPGVPDPPDMASSGAASGGAGTDPGSSAPASGGDASGASSRGSATIVNDAAASGSGASTTEAARSGEQRAAGAGEPGAAGAGEPGAAGTGETGDMNTVGDGERVQAGST
jgi:small subunit ribosomal protein S6